MKNEEKLLLVYYVGVADIDPSQIEEYLNKLKNKIIPQTFHGEIIIIPQHDRSTRVECINPKYITDTELIQQHENLMKELNYKLHNDIKFLKKYENKKD